MARQYCSLFIHFTDTSSAADMCQQTDPSFNITLNCSIRKQEKQEVQKRTGSSDSNFTRKCFLICSVLIFKTLKLWKAVFFFSNSTFLMPVSNKRMIVLHVIVFDMAPGWILPEKLGAAVLPVSQNPYS